MSSAPLAREVEAASSALVPVEGRAVATSRLRRATGCRSGEVLGMRVDATSYAETAETIARLASAGAGGMVCVSTVHMVMEAFDEPDFQRIVNSADRVTPDGVPLVWTLHALGHAGVRRVYGPSLLPIVCGLAAQRGLPVGFYGGTPTVLEGMIGRLSDRIAGLRTAYRFAPPFREMSDREGERVVRDIRESGTRILFVGLGCPKQERWMDAHRAQLPCVMVGVGAAFDFQAGAKPQAPRMLQRAGLEWLFRLGTEPRRLWRRYLHHNPRFGVLVVRQLVSELYFPRGKQHE